MPIPASAQKPVAADPDNAGLGIVLMMGAVAAFAVIDTCAKVLVQDMQPFMVVFARYTLALVYVLAVMWWTGALSLDTRHPWLQVLRGVMLMSTTVLNFVALQYLRLDQTSAIFFSNPLWVCALSPLLLGERIGPRRWAAVLVGFAGVLLIIRPGADSFHWAMFLSLGVAVIAALYQITTRKIGGRDPALVSLLLSTLVGSVLATPMGVVQWQLPELDLVWIMVLMAFAGSAGHHMLIKAHTIAPAPTLAPFVYTQIIWMILLGYLIFNDVPDLFTLLGAAIVVSSGLYVYYREQQVKRRQQGQTS
ncbi:MAG: DMT family transporter [Anderseniella sp.]|nr:DMT family transporter [Anderseniella sp.]